MIGNLKSMIERCIAKMRSGGCADCDRRSSCRMDWAGRLGVPSGHAAAIPESRFATFLAEIARAFEARPARRSSVLRAEVERRIEPLLASGEVSIDRVARALGYSRQTLYRRLKAEGATFEKILDDLRRRLAVELVRDGGMSVKEAAYRLGFSDPAAFSRAYKRWTGASPRARPQSG